MDLSFDPFGKPIDTLQAADLASLRDVQEGWYIEYKRELPNARAIAKSISAFANTYGGWLFIGIEELSKDQPTAGAFPGIEHGKIDSALNTIRQAMSTCLSHPPYIRIHTVRSSDNFPDLPADRAVICVHIPKNLQAPFVHASGQIYRRVADGSEPKPETDRHLIAQLFARGEKLREDIQDWVERDPEFSKAETDLPYIRMLFLPDVWGERSPQIDSSLKEVRSLFGSGGDEFISLPFNSVHQTHRGFTARQTIGNDPGRMTMTWNLWRDAASEIIIPLNCYNGSLLDLWDNFPVYENSERYFRSLHRQGFETIKIVDLNLLFHVISGISNKYEEILETSRWNEGFSFKVRILNCWRFLPFLDVETFVSDIEDNGSLITLNESMTVPTGMDPESFSFSGRNFENGRDRYSRVISTALDLFFPIAEAFGISATAAAGDKIDMKGILEAGIRALNLQAARNVSDQ